MRRAPWVILLVLTVVTLFGVRTARAAQSFTVQVNCTGDPQYVILTSTGNQNLDLSSFRFVSKFETRAGEEITLSGTLQPNLSTRVEAGASAGNPGAVLWTRSFPFDSRNLGLEALVITVGSQIFEVPCGSGTNIASFSLPDSSGLATTTVTPTLTTTATVTATPSATATSTTTLASGSTAGQWFDIPPTLSGAVQSCPPVEGWRLVYWGGQSVPINQAAQSCSVDVVWLNRQGVWYGFAPDFVDQSDSWSQLPSEVAFLHGRAGGTGSGISVASAGTPTPVPTLTLPGGPGGPATATATATITATATTVVGSGTAIAPGPVGPPTIQIVEFTSEVARDGTARLLVRTIPFASCTVSFGPPPNRIPVPIQNAGPRPVDANGYISWSWKVEPTTPTGIGGVAITCKDVTATLDVKIT